MRRFLILFAIIFMSANLFAQTPDTIWTRLYGDRPGWDGYDQLYGATPTYDGGFAMNGNSTSYGDTIKGDQWVVKINSDGDTLWTAPFGDFDRRDYGRGIIETYDNCLVILGHGRVANTTEDYRIRLFKADSLGNELWEKNYVAVNGFNTEKIIETSDSGFAITGWTDDRDVFLFRADSLGDSVWAKTYGGVDDDMGYDLCQTVDGGFMIAGTTESFGAGSYDVYIIRTDSIGDTLWTRTVGTANYEVAYCIEKTHDGNYLVAGLGISTNDDVYLVKIQDDGDTLWTKFTGQAAGNDAANGITATSDNGFLIAGKNYNTINSHSDMYILKIDANGDSLWSFSHITSTHDQAAIAYQAADGKTYLFGTRAPSSSGEYRDYWVFKLNTEPNDIDDQNHALPFSFSLAQNYPNPFNAQTVIAYTLPEKTLVSVDIYDLLGRQIVSLIESEQPAGYHQVTWNAVKAGSGVYFYRISAGEVSETKAMVLIK